MDAVINETGHEEGGLLLQVGNDLPAEAACWRKVVVKSKSSNQQTLYVMHPSDQVRSNQGLEIAEWYNRDVVKNRSHGYYIHFTLRYRQGEESRDGGEEASRGCVECQLRDC